MTVGSIVAVGIMLLFIGGVACLALYVNLSQPSNRVWPSR
tara:strand:+ start:5884 stop:6003 length:120 start_codon:yes stop_codon:yes gene_type:complete